MRVYMMCMCFRFRLIWFCRASDCITQTNSLNHVKLSSIEIGLCRRETADVWSNSGISMRDIETVYKQTCSSKYHAWKFALGTRIQEVVSVDQCDQWHQIRFGASFIPSAVSISNKSHEEYVTI
jgi:hypothetical protein